MLWTRPGAAERSDRPCVSWAKVPCLSATALARVPPCSAACWRARFRAFMRQDAPPSPTGADAGGDWAGSGCAAGRDACARGDLQNLLGCVGQRGWESGLGECQGAVSGSRAELEGMGSTAATGHRQAGRSQAAAARAEDFTAVCEMEDVEGQASLHFVAIALALCEQGTVRHFLPVIKRSLQTRLVSVL